MNGPVRTWFAGGWLVACACAPAGSQVRTSLARVAQVRSIRVTVDPAASGAYGRHGPFTPNAVERAVAARLERRGLRLDPALSSAMRDVARFAPSRHRVPAPLVEGVLARHGIPDPPPRLLVVESEADLRGACRAGGGACDDLARTLEEAVVGLGPSSAAAVVGIGAVGRGAGARTRVVLAVLDRGVELDPFPRTVPVGSRIPLRGRLSAGRARPRIELVLPDGRVETVAAVDRGGGRFDAVVPCPARGTVQVEVLADGRYGPEVVANAPVGCGRDLSPSFVVEVERLRPGTTEAEVARAVFALLQDERRRRGLAPLSYDPALAAVAEAHAREMARDGYVGHHSPKTGDAASRVARAGIEARVVRENVARGYGPREIHASLLRSPGHRANLLAEDVDRVGVGAVFGPRAGSDPDAPRPIYVAQKFIRAPLDPGRDPTKALAVALARAGRPAAAAARGDPALSRLARRDAAAVARGRRLDADARDRALRAAGAEAATRIEASAPALDDLVTAGLWDAIDGPYGFAVARRPDATFVLVVYVRRGPVP